VPKPVVPELTAAQKKQMILDEDEESLRSFYPSHDPNALLKAFGLPAERIK